MRQPDPAPNRSPYVAVAGRVLFPGTVADPAKFLYLKAAALLASRNPRYEARKAVFLLAGAAPAPLAWMATDPSSNASAISPFVPNADRMPSMAHVGFCYEDGIDQPAASVRALKIMDRRR